jgi:hypothetical protein
MPRPAQQQLRDLFNTAVNDARLIYDLNLFHASVSQKLWAADYYCRQLENIDINDYRVFSSTTGTQSAGSPASQDPLIDVPSFCQHLNRLLDGFFIHSRSTLDTLAHEIYALYVSPNIPTRIYIWTAGDMLLAGHPRSKLAGLLNQQLNQRWFTEFEPFRNCTTHESLIAYDDIRWSYEQVIQRYKLSRRIKLPDNPQLRPFTYRTNRIATQHCERLFKRISLLVSRAYEAVLLDFNRNGCVFPIP